MKRTSRKVSAPATREDLLEVDPLSQLQEAKAAYDRFQENERTLRADIRAAKSELADAVSAEAFDKAQAAKAKREELERALSALIATRGSVVTGIQQAAAAAADHYFAVNPSAASPTNVTVTRVVVMNPATGNYAEETYLAGDKTIQLRVDDKDFESEAWHAGEWAISNGFLVKHFVTTASV
ncbi:hypothetical protein [Burkholderia cenocepacia]|uniref:hypothetical protein n=1 Tax=Burkholderia cenocepacia TaxID=95486 RepID=UPI0007612742|nr:hypothetical protein [Burkholderia cenocepacia]KWU17866.1 hypothetical protein AS149_14200 [Burkholderia cenocepacia]